MLILPQRNPLILAKEVATLDRYASGRITLGIGVGWVKEEVEVLGQNFHDRGKRANEWIEILRELWQEGASTHQGEFFRFENIVSSPKPIQPGGPPLMIGGHSEAAARRKAAIAALFFVLGLSTVFLILGFTASAFGAFFLRNQVLFAQISGVVVIIFGLHFLGVFRIPFLDREARMDAGDQGGSSFGSGLRPSQDGSDLAI